MSFDENPKSYYCSAVARDEQIYLRPLEEDDFDDRYLGWFKDPLVTKFLAAKNITRKDAIAHLRCGRDETRFMFAVCDAETNLHIGNIKIGDINRKTSVSDLVTVVGDRAYWGKGLATRAIRLGINIAFSKLNIRKLHACMYAGNIGSLKAYTRAGFVVEAVLYDHFMTPDGAVNKILISCFNPELYPALPHFPLPFPE